MPYVRSDRMSSERKTPRQITSNDCNIHHDFHRHSPKELLANTFQVALFRIAAHPHTLQAKAKSSTASHSTKFASFN